jgi:predicted ATPase
MPKARNNWYVLTGGPATGKTTVLAELKKLGNHVVPEAARQHIDESYKNGISVEKLRSNEKQFQEDVARIKLRYEAELNPLDTVFFDRGMHDTTAYMNYYNYPIDPWLQEIIDSSFYKKIFIFEPLEVDKLDYARTEDAEFMRAIDKKLFKAYNEAGMNVTLVAPDTIANRVKFILENL